MQSATAMAEIKGMTVNITANAAAIVQGKPIMLN
jgi:hypothetical protein